MLDRLACIDLPAFPLQLLLRRERADWRERPVAVVEQDKPQARILWVNEQARGCGILPGLRYAAGLARASDLCAGTVPGREIEAGIALVAGRLQSFSPEIEPSPLHPGLFWLNASGLQRIYRSQGQWAGQIRADLKDAGFFLRIAIGFDRFGTYALARSGQGPETILCRTPEQERACALQVRLDRLGVDPRVRDSLHTLGIDTIRQLLELPPAGLRDRFGKAIHALHRLARGAPTVRLDPQKVVEPLRQQMVLDHPERDVTRLLFLIKPLLHDLLAGLVQRRQVLAELVVEFEFDRGSARVEKLVPADPTVEGAQLLDLVLLRLKAVRLPSGVIGIALDGRGVPASSEQLSLFREQPRRDPAAAGRALARLAAEFGDRAVACARLREGHLPEARFDWVPFRAIVPPQPRRVLQRTLVRRFYTHPLALPYRPCRERDGWQLRGGEDAPVDKLRGPYVISGGWWRQEVFREYHYVHNLEGEWMWIYHDRVRRRWFLHARVE